MSTAVRIALVLAALPATAAAGGPQTPAELAELIACKGGITDYNALAQEITGPGKAGALKRLGLKAVKSANPFLAEYSLKAPIAVFGRSASRIAFNSAGVFALLDEADPHPLAKELGITPDLDTPSKFLGEKLVREDEETLPGGDTTLTSRVTLNVSTITSHPGKVLAGCGYQVGVE
jgi:hypothetical protein